MEYRITSGDTLSALARTHGTSVDAIVEANREKITNPDRIYAGDTITIPDGTKAALESAHQAQPRAQRDERPTLAPARDAEAGADAVPAPASSDPTTADFMASTQVAGARGSEDGNFEQRVTDLVNGVRARHGLPALAFDSRLDAAAERHAVHQARVQVMAHEGIGDGTPGERMQAAGWDAAWGENVAVGQTTPEQVVAEWLASPGHRANILNPSYGFLSVAYTTDATGRPYWAQAFGAAVA